jgi:methionyl-tRNA formyltransferase
MKKFKVFISGQKFFAEEVFRLCQKLDIEIVGVSCPLMISISERLPGVGIFPLFLPAV